ncbi:MAG: DUF58 domain-containing protein [Cytophagales bacterium]
MNLKLSDISIFEKLDFLTKQVVEGFITGLHKSPYHGFSIEFSEHKIYNAGESTRHIDWKVYAKTDRLYTKRYEEETNLRCNIVIDTSSSMFYPQHKDSSKINFSIFAAACISYLCQKQRDGFGLTFFNKDIVYQSEIKSSAAHLHKMLTQLNSLASNTESINNSTHITQTLEYLAGTLHKRSLIVLFTDMFDANNTEEQTDRLFNSLAHLKHQKHEVIIFNVYDFSTEINFEFEEKPYTFVDIESGEKIKLVPSQIKETYQKEALKYLNELKYRCEQYKISLVDIDINDNWQKLLLSFLLKRSKMK